MIKRLAIWRPKEGVSREAALAQWRGSHARLVEQVTGVRRYVQNETLAGPDGSEPASAGVGELWFDSVEAARAALTTPEWQAVIADASAFMDLENVSALWVEEHEVL